MDPHVIVPIVAMLSLFGMPVGIIYVVKHFRLKEKELALEAGFQDERAKELEARILLLEASVTSLERSRKELPAGGAAPRQLPP